MNPSNIWIIDDDLIYQVIAKKYFQNTGIAHTLTSFHNGEEALNALKQASPLPDLILLDINMPIMDGWDFLDQFELLRPEIREHPRIFLVSSSIAYSDHEKAKRYGLLKGHLKKPLTASLIAQLFET